MRRLIRPQRTIEGGALPPDEENPTGVWPHVQAATESLHSLRSHTSSLRRALRFRAAEAGSAQGMLVRSGDGGKWKVCASDGGMMIARQHLRSAAGLCRFG